MRSTIYPPLLPRPLSHKPIRYKWTNICRISWKASFLLASFAQDVISFDFNIFSFFISLSINIIECITWSNDYKPLGWNVCNPILLSDLKCFLFYKGLPETKFNNQEIKKQIAKNIILKKHLEEGKSFTYNTGSLFILFYLLHPHSAFRCLLFLFVSMCLLWSYHFPYLFSSVLTCKNWFRMEQW